MKKKYIRWVLIVFLFLLTVVHLLGVGYTSSGAAVHDLKEELRTIYGDEYAGRTVDGGTEDMVFVIEPKTWFMTNWNLRQSMGMNYEYDCNVIFTRYVTGEPVQTRTVCYLGIDPMGKEHTTDRAYIDLDSKVEINTTK